MKFLSYDSPFGQLMMKLCYSCCLNRSACMVSTAIKSLAQRNTSGSSGRAERGTSISVECRLIQNASSTGTPARVIAERKAT